MIMGIPTAPRGATAQAALRMAGTRRLIRLSAHAPLSPAPPVLPLMFSS